MDMDGWMFIVIYHRLLFNIPIIISQLLRQAISRELFPLETRFVSVISLCDFSKLLS